MRDVNVIQAFKGIFSSHRIPIEVFSDNCPQFVSAEFHEFATAYGFDHRTSSSLHPQANGLVERSVKKIKALITKAKSSGGDFYLALLAYRTAPHETTGVSPAHLLMVRRLRTTLHSLPGVLAPKVARRDTVQETDERSKQQERKYYDQRTGAQPLRQLDIHDRVLV